MQLLASLGHPNKPHFLGPFFFTLLKNKSSSELCRQECHWEDAMAKLDNSILESSDKDIQARYPSKESNKGSDTEPTIIPEATEKSAHQVPQFK
jgi:hypothetical protein